MDNVLSFVSEVSRSKRLFFSNVAGNNIKMTRGRKRESEDFSITYRAVARSQCPIDRRELSRP